MRSIKPGRAPSWGGVFGGIIAAIFGMFWIGLARSIGAPGFFLAFGVLFVGVALFNMIYSFYNATSRRRFSTFDITEDGEEPDPLERELARHRLRRELSHEPRSESIPTSKPHFCTACGTGLNQEFQFCPQCGKKV